MYSLELYLGIRREPSLVPFTRPDQSGYRYYELHLRSGDRFRSFHAVADPTDQARFFLPYELRGQRGEFVAWIDEKDVLHLRIKSGALEAEQLKVRGRPVPGD